MHEWVRIVFDSAAFFLIVGGDCYWMVRHDTPACRASQYILSILNNAWLQTFQLLYYEWLSVELAV